MTPTVKTGLAIGIATFLWTLLMGYTGWYKDPAMVPVFFFVIVFEVVLLYWGLRQTAGVNGYGRQVLAGTGMAVVAAVIIAIGSYVFTTVLFPTYFADLREMQVALLRQQQVPEEDIARQVEQAMAMETPVVNALTGAVGTIVTGVVASALLAISVRRK